jgi:predicted 2-oxoglutarate/Fe(II)-dependent dioxygenase YbiX
LIIEIPNAIGMEDVERIRNAVQPFLSQAPTTTFYRDGKTVNISKTLELHETNNYLHALFSEVQRSVLQQRYKPPFSSGDSGYEYHLYRPEEVCHHHEDFEFTDTRQQETSIRYASVTLHLNTVKEGGELVFPAQNKKVKTEAGKIVVFPPYGMFGHYTTPSEEPREVVVTWFIYDGIKAVRT